ncbi:MAG: hypothetical protein KatS3mg082_2946 [Nitrospiraceae bacterium]|nr:MAG: hypothetical protein KatS3mg082_2946 [Nitrospiraceae bacterium]
MKPTNLISIWIALAVAVLPVPALSQSASFRHGFQAGESFALSITNTYRMSSERGGAPYSTLSHDFGVAVHVVAGEVGPTLECALSRAAQSVTRDLLRAALPIRFAAFHPLMGPDPLLATVSGGFKATLGADNLKSESSGVLGMLGLQDPMQLPLVQFGIGMTELPASSVSAGETWGEKTQDQPLFSMEMRNRLASMSGDIAVVETTVRAKVKDLRAYMDQLREDVPPGMLDFEMTATTRFNTRTGRSESLTLRATYPLEIDGESRSIRSWVEQEITVRLM